MTHPAPRCLGVSWIMILLSTNHQYLYNKITFANRHNDETFLFNFSQKSLDIFFHHFPWFNLAYMKIQGRLLLLGLKSETYHLDIIEFKVTFTHIVSLWYKHPFSCRADKDKDLKWYFCLIAHVCRFVLRVLSWCISVFSPK